MRESPRQTDGDVPTMSAEDGWELSVRVIEHVEVRTDGRSVYNYYYEADLSILKHHETKQEVG